MSKITKKNAKLLKQLENECGYKMVGVCCLCGNPYSHWGNNPYPLCDEDDYVSRCCDACNWMHVFPARLQQYTDYVKQQEEASIQNS